MRENSLLQKFGEVQTNELFKLITVQWKSKKKKRRTEEPVKLLQSAWENSECIVNPEQTKNEATLWK